MARICGPMSRFVVISALISLCDIVTARRLPAQHQLVASFIFICGRSVRRPVLPFDPQSIGRRFGRRDRVKTAAPEQYGLKSQSNPCYTGLAYETEKARPDQPRGGL